MIGKKMIGAKFKCELFVINSVKEGVHVVTI